MFSQNNKMNFSRLILQFNPYHLVKVLKMLKLLLLNKKPRKLQSVKLETGIKVWYENK